jgi:hypothetical protein
VNPAPVMAGNQTAAEMVEMYWAAQLRDVAFDSYASSAVAIQAAAEINGLSGYAGPRNGGGQVTTNELFRGSFAGELVGPYLSQFLLIPTFCGAQPISQRFQTFLPSSAHLVNDFMIDFADWLSIQNGYQPSNAVAMDPTYRYLRNGRDLSAWTHVDALYEAYFTAYLVLQTIGCPANPGLYSSATEATYGTLGSPDAAATIGDVAQKALEAVWFQKWFVHRRARPEVAGALAHLILTGQGANTDVTLNSDLLNSEAIAKTHSKYGSYLLPQAFPEGSPTHPSYPTGHGAVGGACITVLKFFFNTNFVIPKPVETNNGGTTLSPYTGSPLTVQGELNKLAHNITFAHGIHPGIHYRSDSDESLLLGEAVALSILQDKAATYNEPFSVTITKFDGTTVTISNP